MASYDQSIVDVLRSAVRDAQDLVQGEIALAKAELREEMRRTLGAAVVLVAAAMAAVIALVFLLTAAAQGLADGLAWPMWAGFAVVGLAVAIIAAVLALMGRRRLAVDQRMPLTVETLKENVKWLKARTS